jgi:uroporphyrinogen III methyltransferase/synthase
MVFGRAAEEVAALVRAGVPFEIVPGISAAAALASYAGIPITERGRASAVAWITGQEGADKEKSDVDFQALARFPGTLVFYMGVTTARRWTSELMAAGMPADRGVALVRRCTWPDQQVIRCRLDEVVTHLSPRSKFPPPVLAVVGDVVNESVGWDWFTQRPLFGERVLVTRSAEQAEELAGPLRELGAEVICQPAIVVRDPPSWDAVDRALAEIDTYDWLVFSSRNGVDRFLSRAAAQSVDRRRLLHPRWMAVGPGTAEALRARGLPVDGQPADQFCAEGILECLGDGVANQRVLLVRANRGRDVLREELTARGASVNQVVAYETHDVESFSSDVRRALADGRRTWILVASSATARAVVRALGAAPANSRWISLSSITTEILEQLHVGPIVQATKATMQGLVEAVVRAVHPEGDASAIADRLAETHDPIAGSSD